MLQVQEFILYQFSALWDKYDAAATHNDVVDDDEGEDAEGVEEKEERAADGAAVTPLSPAASSGGTTSINSSSRARVAAAGPRAAAQIRPWSDAVLGDPAALLRLRRGAHALPLLPPPPAPTTAPPPAPTPLPSSSAYHGRRAGLLAPDILELPYRQLVSEPCAALETVYAHAGVVWGAPTEALHAQQARDMRAHAVNAFAPLPEALRALLRGRWGPYYDAFGYK